MNETYPYRSDRYDWLENSSVCAKIVDRDFKLQYMSKAGVEGLGIDDITSFYGKPYPLDFYPDLFRQEMIDKLMQAMTTGEPNVMEGSVSDLAGKKKWYQSMITPVLDDMQRVEFFNVVSIDTTARHQAEEALAEKQEMLQALASNLALAEERERKRISILLHEDVCQNLTYAKMMLHMAEEIGNDETQAKYFEKSSAVLEQTMKDVRSLSFDLSGTHLAEYGLENGIAQWLTDRFEPLSETVTTFHDDGQAKPLSESCQILLFRSVRELLNNIIKHSQATRVEVSVSCEQEQILIHLQDNGIGVDTETALQ